jgi:hypothetical protein
VGGEEKNGPKRLSCVIWAIGTLFLSSLCFFYILTTTSRFYQCSTYIMKACGGLWWVVTGKTGPNDTSCVWALGREILYYIM